ncbi:MAG: hypothetical protein R3C18_09375 [Planctomycetaceae bacterium]
MNLNAILTLVDELRERNAQTATALLGGAFCLSIERPTSDIPWLQLKSGVINFYYDDDAPPEDRLAAKSVELPPGFRCVELAPEKYATCEFEDVDAHTTRRLVRSLVLNYFDLPDDDSYSAEFIDLR